MSSNHSLIATIKDASLREPDSDGDTRLEGNLLLETTCDHVLELFIAQQLLLGSDGAVLSVSNDEREDSLEAGDKLSLDLDSGYLKASSLGDSTSATIQVELLGCKADYLLLPSVQLGDGVPGLYGWNQAIQLGSCVTIESLSIAVKPVDDDGDVRIELRALVRNLTDQRIPRFTFKARAVAAGGREIDDRSTEETLAPNEIKAMEVSFYAIKENRMKGLSIAADATAFSIQCRANAKAEVGIGN
jgi:hypothetical protein